jgi:hypothetical protein
MASTEDRTLVYPDSELLGAELPCQVQIGSVSALKLMAYVITSAHPEEGFLSYFCPANCFRRNRRLGQGHSRLQSALKM